MRRITPTLVVGPGITADDVPRLRRSGITAILSLQQPGGDIRVEAMARVRAACAIEPAIAYENVAIRDYDPHDLIRRLPDAITTLRELTAHGRTVYLHCCEGVNRAPSAALAYLVLERGMAVDDALERLRAAHAGARPYAEFVAWMRSAQPVER